MTESPYFALKHFAGRRSIVIGAFDMIGHEVTAVAADQTAIDRRIHLYYHDLLFVDSITIAATTDVQLLKNHVLDRRVTVSEAS